MCTIITASNGHVLGTHNFATGKFVPAQRSSGPRCLTKEEARAHAAWLRNHHGADEADEFLANWTSDKMYSVH